MPLSGSSGSVTNITNTYNGAGLPVFNVKASPFNATGDGTTNDTTAVQAAINAAQAAGGGTIFFPPGTYSVNPLTGFEGAIFQGAGQYVSKIKKRDTTTDSVTLSLGGRTVAVRDLQFVGYWDWGPYGYDWATNPVYGAALGGFWFDCTITDCTFYFFKNAIYCPSGSAFLVNRVERCTFTANQYAIKLIGSAGSGINNNIFNQLRLAANGNGVYIDGGAGNIFNGCDVEDQSYSDTQYALYFGAKLDAIHPNVVRDTYFEGTGVVVCENDSPMTVFDGCGFTGASYVDVKSGARAVVGERCRGPRLKIRTGAGPVRTHNCDTPTIVAGSDTSTYTATDNF